MKSCTDKCFLDCLWRPKRRSGVASKWTGEDALAFGGGGEGRWGGGGEESSYTPLPLSYTPQYPSDYTTAQAYFK